MLKITIDHHCDFCKRKFLTDTFEIQSGEVPFPHIKKGGWIGTAYACSPCFNIAFKAAQKATKDSK